MKNRFNLPEGELADLHEQFCYYKTIYENVTQDTIRESVGLKVAMGNASDALKSKADVVTDSVDDDGMVQIIKKYS